MDWEWMESMFVCVCEIAHHPNCVIISVCCNLGGKATGYSGLQAFYYGVAARPTSHSHKKEGVPPILWGRINVHFHSTQICSLSVDKMNGMSI
jgi:hypothetical protein